MTTLAHGSMVGGPRNGGVAARRAVIRWAWRMFRREWRQQILVVTLLTVAVAAAIGSITIAYNAVPADDGDFGSANQVLTFDSSDRESSRRVSTPPRSRSGRSMSSATARCVSPAASRRWTTDHKSLAAPTAASCSLSVVAATRTAPAQVAVTDGVAESLRLEIGSSLALDGHRRTVVGIVENPSKLSDEFALVSPSSASADRVDVLVNADAGPRSSDSFFQSLGDRSRSAFAGSMTRGNDASGAAETLAIFSVATVFLLLASLVAAAGFAVVAQRRVRQLGMLAAIGATEKHRRLVLLTNGAVVGALAAFIGTIAGIALWVAFAPTLESAVDHRINRLSLPWALIAMAVVLAVVGATVAAWWPGRTVARLPVLLALSGRPPQPRPARHSAIAATALIAVGVACLALSDRDSPPLIIGGLVATILGTLLLGPLATRIFALAAGRAPIAARLALRDLARYQARSGAALAAITLALGIAAAVVITAAAAEKQEDDRAAAGLPNLSDRQIRVYTGPTQRPELIPLPIQTPAQLARSAARVRHLAAGLAQATVIPLRKALQAGEPPIVEDGNRALVTVGLARQVDPKRWTLGSGLYVATPALLRHLGVDPATIDPSADFLADQTVPTNELVILDIRARKQLAVANVQRIDSEEVLGSGGEVERPTGLVRHARWAPAPRLDADRERLARRVEPTSHQRADRRRPRARRRGWPRDRDAARERLPQPRRSPSRPPLARFWRSQSSP